MYIGTTAGAFWQHPGILWPRDTEGCDANYDPRVRPWYVSGASGPKNVVLILDTSGSMGRNDRLGNMQEAAKLVVSGLTHADSVAVVTFSSDAASENNYLVPATASYRSKISSWIEKTKAAGSTNYTGALASAINIVRRSESSDRITGCRTAYVFLSDGEPNEFEDGRMSDIQAQIARLRAEGDDSGPEEKVFWFGLGTGGDQAEEVLADLACQSSSVYTPVPDFDPRGLAQSLAGYQHFFSAELGYLNENAPAYTPKVSFSEPYTSIPDIWGQVTTAVAPVYDRSSTPWVLVGVAAVDIPVCEFETAVEATGYVGTPSAAVRETKTGCTCDTGSYTYDGATFNGCTDYDWATPWCATTDCGTCDGSTSSGCWDECDVSNTPKGLVESELQARSLDDSCAEMSLDDCALLALREASWDGYSSSPCGSQRCGTGARLTPSNPFEGVSGWSDFESTGYSSTDNKKDVCDDPSQSTAICGTCDAVVMHPPCTNEACVEGARRREEKRYVDPILQMCGHAKFPADGDDPYYGEPVRGRDDNDNDGPITDDEGGESKQIPIYYFAPVAALAGAVFMLHSRAKRRRAAATRGQQGPSSFQAGMGAGAPPTSQPRGLQMFGRQAPSPGYVTAPPVYVDGAGAQMQPGAYVVAAPGGPPPPPVVVAAPGGYMPTTQPVGYAPQGASPLPPQPPPGY